MKDQAKDYKLSILQHYNAESQEFETWLLIEILTNLSHDSVSRGLAENIAVRVLRRMDVILISLLHS